MQRHTSPLIVFLVLLPLNGMGAAVESMTQPAAARSVSQRQASLGATAVTMPGGDARTTDAAFFAQLTANGSIVIEQRVPNNPAVTITARLQAATEDVGQAADVLFVANYNNAWFMKSPQGWLAWDQQLGSLVAVSKVQALQANMDVTVEAELTLLGDFAIYIGYRRPGVIHYSPVPFSFSVVNPSPGLTISDFSLPAAASGGSLITLSARVTNNGETPAGTVLRFYQSGDAVIEDTDSEICTDTIPLLAPLGSREQQCKTPVPPVLTTYYYGVCIDGPNSVSKCAHVGAINATPLIDELPPAPPSPIVVPIPTAARCTSPLIFYEGVCTRPSSEPMETHTLNDTGIVACADNQSNGLACSLSDFPGQDAEAGRDINQYDSNDGHAGFSFTKLGSNGQVLAVSAMQWSCVKDNVTGLVWEVKTEDQGLHDKDWTYSWYQPDNLQNGGFQGVQNGGICGTSSQCDTYAYVSAVNQAGWCGATNWRMPTLGELAGIASLDRINPALDSDYFPHSQARWYWSSSAAGIKDYAWYVFFNHGLFSWNAKGEKGSVRLVRGEAVAKAELSQGLR